MNRFFVNTSLAFALLVTASFVCADSAEAGFFARLCGRNRCCPPPCCVPEPVCCVTVEPVCCGTPMPLVVNGVNGGSPVPPPIDNGGLSPIPDGGVNDAAAPVAPAN